VGRSDTDPGEQRLMASRKEQLNAYTFARKRTVAAFLQPTPSGSDEGAPRPLRAIGPSLVVGAVVLAGFGAWGMISPTAPKGWSQPYRHVIVADESTTRYVVLKDGKSRKPVLHPVLNMASARLLLENGFDVIKVKESVLDKSGLKHGATIGIPYAPDRLPNRAEAARAKKWAVCDRPSRGTADAPEQAVFVLGGGEAKTMDNASRLRGNDVLYVRGGDGAEYLVDRNGTRFQLGGPNWRHRNADEMDQLRTTLFAENAKPEPVKDAWLSSLNQGEPIWFPHVAGRGTRVKLRGLPEETVGTVLEAPTAAGSQYYVVLRNGVAPVSPFTALLLLTANNQSATQHIAVPGHRLPWLVSNDWPKEQPRQVNKATDFGRARTVACSVLRGPATASTRARLSVWAGTDYPASIVEGATSAYVTPGTGLLFTEVSGRDVKSGTLYLLTDTGLRYSVSRNNDSAAAKRGSKSQQDYNTAQIRLGYERVRPMSIPSAWAEFLPKGPTLDTQSASQPQGS
jgi:type VII secretion protein EccB